MTNYKRNLASQEAEIFDPIDQSENVQNSSGIFNESRLRIVHASCQRINTKDKEVTKN